MVEKQIANPAGLYGLGPDWDAGVIVHVKNGSAATRTVGDVVKLPAPTASTNYPPTVTTTTTAGDEAVWGVVVDQPWTGPDPEGSPGGTAGFGSSGATYAANAEMPVMIMGVGRVNIGANTVAALDHLFTFTTAGQAQSETTATLAHVGAYIGIALESQANKDSNNTIRAIIQKH